MRIRLIFGTSATTEAIIPSIILGEKRMRVSELSRLTGISQNALNKIYNNKTKGIDFETLDKLCIVLQKNTNEIFEFIGPFD